MDPISKSFVGGLHRFCRDYEVPMVDFARVSARTTWRASTRPSSGRLEVVSRRPAYDRRAPDWVAPTSCILGMVRIGVRELRQQASRYLSRVKAGEIVEVTEWGHLVALLVPPDPATS
jgi:hypothetical protein